MTERKYIPAEDFIRIWQAAKTLDEVAEKAGITRRSATFRACKYRARGIPLKYMDHPDTLNDVDIERLAALSKELAP